MTYALRLDLDRCVGCMACAVACMDQNDLEVGGEPTAWRQVFTVESGAFPEARVRYVSMACMHCGSPNCLSACPTRAIYRDLEFGVVLVERKRCIGCRYCSWACEFGAPQFGRDGLMQKCDLCIDSVDFAIAVPHCVASCPTEAIRFTRMAAGD